MSNISTVAPCLERFLQRQLMRMFLVVAKPGIRGAWQRKRREVAIGKPGFSRGRNDSEEIQL